MKALLLFCFLSTFSCVNKTENNTKNILESTIQVVENDSIKSSLRDRIIIKYLNISITELSKDNVKYNEYSEFKHLDSLFNAYNKTGLSDKELQYLKITKSKRYLLTANYDKAILELNTLSKDEDLEEYKSLLLGISYELKGDSISSNQYFEKLLSKVNDLMKNNDECSKYLLLNTLLGKQKLALCEEYAKEYEELLLIEKREIIRIHFLSDIEL